MKIGISSEAFLNHYGFSEGLHKMKATGFECLDYGDFTDTTHPLFAKSNDEFDRILRNQRKEIEAAGIEISQTHGPWRWPPQDSTPEERAERFEKMSRSIRGTALLGCRNFVIHPIMPYGCERDVNPRLMWEMNLEFMGRLLEVAKQYDVVICFENMPMFAMAMASVPATLDFVKAMNSPNFKMCLDTGHCACLDMPIGEAVRLIGKNDLQVLHVHDNNGRMDMHSFPYFGVCDWNDFSDALQEIGFDGSMSLELKIPHAVPDDIRPLFEKALYQMSCKIAKRPF